MLKLITLLVLLLFGSLGSQRYDLIDWYRVYETKGYMTVDSTEYVEIDLRVYPPKHQFYDDTTMTEYSWKLCVWFSKKEKSPLSGIGWVQEYTETYGTWIQLNPVYMYLRADSLRKHGDIVWHRQEGDGTMNSYFLYDHGNHYDLQVLNLRSGVYTGVASFLK
jgi:hypothetical protein